MEKNEQRCFASHQSFQIRQYRFIVKDMYMPKKSKLRKEKVINPLTTIIFVKVENRKLFQRAPSPSDFPLVKYFWIYFTCGFDIRDFIWVTCGPIIVVKGLRDFLVNFFQQRFLLIKYDKNLRKP